MSEQNNLTKYQEALKLIDFATSLGFVIGVCSDVTPDRGQSYTFEGADTKYLHIGWKNRIEWAHDPFQAHKFKTFDEANTFLTAELAKPPVDICGLLHPAIIYKSGLSIGEASKPKGRGVFFIKTLVFSAPLIKFPTEQEITVTPKKHHEIDK
jgi:hypothetical protein